MEQLTPHSFTPEPYSLAIDAFFSRLNREEPGTFFEAVKVFNAVDTAAMATAHVTALSQSYFTANRAERERLGDYLPCFGHVRIASRLDVAISYSVRRPMDIYTEAMSTSSRDEFHRIDRGVLDFVECKAIDAANDPRYLPASCLRLSAGGQIGRAAGSSAYVLKPQEICHVFSVASWSQSPFTKNVDSATGAVVSHAFSSPDDCILANILELCALHPTKELGEEALKFVAGHNNHRVRIAALKAALVAGALDTERAAQIATNDEHPVIRNIGTQMLREMA